LAAWLGIAIASLVLLSPTSGTATRFSKPVSFAILEDYDKGDDLAAIDRDFALFRELGVTTWRGSFGWDDYEPRRGSLDFAWLDEFVALARRRGIRLRPYLGYTPEWAARPGGSDREIWNNPPRDAARFARFAAALAQRLRQYPNVLSYEIYNEENVAQWWDADAPAYGQLLAHAARSLKRANRGAQIVFGGLVFPDAGWIEAVCGQPGVRGSFDVLPFHAYPETWTPPDVTVENYLGGVDNFIDDADRSCGRTAIWINETGFATVPGKSERDQAAWWVRAIATFVAHRRIEHIGVYEIKDLPAGKPVIGDAPNYHLGLTRADRSKKLAFQTVAMLINLLDTGTLTVDEDAVAVVAGDGNGSVFHHLFERPDGDRVLFAWSRGGSRRVAVTFSDAHQHVTELSFDGSRRPAMPIAAGVANDIQLEAELPRIFRLGH
jgi:polysaccharide biosynthesis protein PslG